MSKKHICKVEDDSGAICNSEVKKKQWKQDGMCSRCAELTWFWHRSLWSGKEVPFLFKEKSHEESL